MKKVTLSTLVRSMIRDDWFWCGGITKNEDKYVAELGLTEDQQYRFFKAMYEIQRIGREINNCN